MDGNRDSNDRFEVFLLLADAFKTISAGYPSHFQPDRTHLSHAGFVSSHLIRLLLMLC